MPTLQKDAAKRFPTAIEALKALLALSRPAIAATVPATPMLSPEVAGPK